MEVVTALTHAFLPQESNHHKARLIQAPILVFILFFFLLFQKGISIATLEPGVLGYASQISPTEVIRLTNEKRVAGGLSALKENTLLDKAAAAKGADMLAKGYWAHVAPDGTQPWDFFKTVGYKYRYAGENLARDFTNPSSTVDAWMASPSHKENLMSDHYKDIGVAVVEGSLNGKDTTIVVQLFGASSTATAQVPSAAAAEVKKTASVAAETKEATPATQATASVVAQAENTEKEVVSPSQVPDTGLLGTGTLTMSRVVSMFVIAFLFGAIVIDAVVLWLKGHSRSSSSPFAHIAFLGMVFAILIVAKAGQIL